LVLRYIYETGVFEDGSEGFAGLVNGVVRIGLLGGDSVGLDPFEG
jgi:hypothetical protein